MYIIELTDEEYELLEKIYQQFQKKRIDMMDVETLIVLLFSKARTVENKPNIIQRLKRMVIGRED